MTDTWYLAICAVCGDGLIDPMPMPFAERAARSDWVEQHMDSTGHSVLLMNQHDNDGTREDGNDATT